MTAPQSVTRAATGMGIATAASRAVGFVRILVIAAVLGTTYLGNAYQSSNSVSNVLFELLAAGALSAVLVPTFVHHLDRGDQPEAERLAGRILGVALVALGVIVVIAEVAAPWIARLLTAGVDRPAIASRQRELSTFLLRFFVPQVLLYAVGAVSVAVLYAKRRLAVTAIAPIGLTVVVVATMAVFRAQTGPHPTLDLGDAEKLTLALGGTLGVVAFVAIPSVALWRSGFRLVPRLGARDPEVGRVLGLSGWAVLQHSMVGLLLAAAIVVGNTVEGGTLAYQVAWLFFLAPYAVLAQPVHTVILPDLARRRERVAAFAASLRWALDSMAVLVVPVSAALVALALPIMRVAAFGQATRAGGVELLSAGLAALAVGLYAYSAFLLFARAYYALGNSRTPATVAIGSAVVGIAVMVVAAEVSSGPETVAAIGAGHTIAYTAGALVLAVGLRRRTRGESLWPRCLWRATVAAGLVGAGTWGVVQVAGSIGRWESAALLVGVLAIGAPTYVVLLRALHGFPGQPPAHDDAEAEPPEPLEAEVDL